MSKRSLIFLTLMVAAGATIFITTSRAGNKTVKSEEPTVVEQPQIVETEKIVKVEITEGSTFSDLMTEAGVGASVAAQIFEASISAYDLSKIRVGRTIDLIYDIASGELIRLVYQADSESELIVTKQNESWSAEKKTIDYEVRVRTVEGTIESSMYQAAIDQGIDLAAVVEMANVFQWSVDFSMVQKGDTFKFIYEERYRDGKYVMPGQVIAGKFNNEGTEQYVFYFEDNENKAFFDENGNSVQKVFLKAPVEYRYISSGYTTGLRYVAAFNVSTGHRAIDYAAAAGTPIRAVGDGVVTYAGWNGPYGNFVTIRHNGTYSTNYAHQSKIAVKKGQRVSQSQVIGYVGSTGFSTGPHLHYEMVKDGVKINPLKEILPPGEPISEANRQAFFDHIESLKQQLN